MYSVKHILLVLSLLYCNGHAWRKVKIVYTKLAYEYNKGFVEANATLYADGSLSFYAKPVIDVDRMFLTTRIKFSSDGSSNFDIDFTNKTVDICKFSRDYRYEPLIQLVYKILSEKIHLPQRCPVKKNEIFYTNKFSFETDKLPPILRNTKVSLHLIFSALKVETLIEGFELKLEGEIKYLN